MEKYEAKLTEEEFNQLHADIDKTRKSAEFVKVNKQALQRLLMDHSNLWELLEVPDYD